MQDNVAQDPLVEVLDYAFGEIDGGKPDADDASVLRVAFEHFGYRLASTAQPEVKALVEALEAIKAQTSAEDDAGENYRWDDREGALDFAYATAAQALAAYHEAQP